MTIRHRRSALYMPASNARAIAKARTLACDVVILDLEDAVAPDEKAAARDRVVEAVREGGFGTRELVVRVNGLDTPWYADDIAAIHGSGIDAVLVPKVSSVSDLTRVRALLGEDGPPVWAMIETCAAILALPSLSAAAAETQLTALIVGTNDLAKEMRCRLGADRMPLIPALTATIMAARAAGIVALDGVCNALDDPTRFAAECIQGATLGFDGKTLIHPSQIDAANAGFGPSEEELAWARTIVTAFAKPENADKGAIRLDGQMVERLHLAEAEATLAR
ncbi:citrate lyase subunit beta/citryl-CoA lyase [Sphingomonas sp. PP-CE-3A-406]|uniref:HpcH/HpaI aldolase/citrate lyase family protein n=1 Tax=unclassified Sphingomonas TaxID=196159 RepID=UPI000713099A|nr:MULTISPECIES: CoA ester lyase [unclassified Sphingomonas]KQO05634.1 malyl-CoA thiolesterase [Sphingomonas sp. Leaf242]RMB52098.1 citrate lyase subunit beta/citryl-CoA lyase [Sphingomonas sp. PP-CE-3A-406]